MSKSAAIPAPIECHEGINRLAADAQVLGKEGHHGVESKSIREKILIARVEVSTGDGRRIEGQAHVGQTRANELTIHSGIMGEGGAKDEINIISLVSKVVLKLESLDIIPYNPKLRIILQF